MKENDLLKKLIEIPSQIGFENEGNIAKYLCELLKKYNFKIEKHTFKKNRPNIIAKYTFKKSGPTIIFNGHMDTVPFINGENTWKYPYDKATLVGNKIYGRGACDMKGGIACALSAIFECIEKQTGCGTIIVNLVCDEENTGLYGTVPLCENKLLKGDFAIIMEPTECVVCPGQLGNMFFESHIKGDGGHTGLPEGKTNSFEIAYDYINELKKWIITKRKNKNDSQPFINIGRFEGGTSSGTIPSECTLFWGTRVMPQDNFIDYQKEVIKLTNDFNKKLPKNCHITTDLFEGGGIDSFISNSKYIDKLINISKKDAGVFPASSDAGFISNMLSINSVVYGPGSLKQAHLSNEYVTSDDMKECKRVLYEFLINVGDENE